MQIDIHSISLWKVKFHKLLTHFHFYDVIWHYDNHAPATTTTSLIKLLFQQFIFIKGTTFLPNLVAMSQATTEINGRQNPPLGIECLKTPRSDRVKVSLFVSVACNQTKAHNMDHPFLRSIDSKIASTEISWYKWISKIRTTHKPLIKVYMVGFLLESPNSVQTCMQKLKRGGIVVGGKTCLLFLLFSIFHV